jgi:hypothetical protein
MLRTNVPVSRISRGATLGAPAQPAMLAVSSKTQRAGPLLIWCIRGNFKCIIGQPGCPIRVGQTRLKQARLTESLAITEDNGRDRQPDAPYFARRAQEAAEKCSVAWYAENRLLLRILPVVNIHAC